MGDHKSMVNDVEDVWSLGGREILSSMRDGVCICVVVVVVLMIAVGVVVFIVAVEVVVLVGVVVLVRVFSIEAVEVDSS